MYLINHVRDLEGMGRSEKLLLFIMATYAKEDDGTGIWPGLDLLARKCNLCERQIRRLIFSLLEKGYLVEDGFKGHYKKYKINVEKLWPGYIEARKEAKKKRSKHTTSPAPEEEHLQDVHLPPAGSNGFHPPADDSPERGGPPALSTIMRNRSSPILPRWEDRQEGESAVDYARRMQRGK